MHKKIKPLIGCLLLAVSGTPLFSSSSPNIPELFFEYGMLFDVGVCSNTESKPISAAMVDELDALLPRIQVTWKQEGESLLTATTQLFNIPFSRKELSVNFILCDTLFTGMSYPLLIKIRNFLKSSNENPLPGSYLTMVIYHELLHRYIHKDIPGLSEATGLLKKYEAESTTVKAHFHLLAIQKYVYHALNRDNEFEDNIKIMLNNTWSPAYQRAWDIVNEEGHMAFINEILDLINQQT
ncbi:hypothetical protein [Legionella bononiensis]|uniref:Uncharacterized protein n=1 Tax=Legionella bononiensis TaxID=2793102 RepID=A0ABS1WDZ9_9GAMM|nr:hypothetical protein [Legionella bononiensis]MBL7479549.1 hypothetical protein [Legionella bononiensis]MBL7527577.1 hypothetical protein [Legionella bononiensis]